MSDESSILTQSSTVNSPVLRSARVFNPVSSRKRGAEWLTCLLAFDVPLSPAAMVYAAILFGYRVLT